MTGLERNPLARLAALCLIAGTWGCGAAQHPDQGTHPRWPEPLTADQLVEVGVELARRGDTMRAEQYFTQALAEGADEDEVLPHLLEAYIRDRQYRLAAQRTEDYLRHYPNCMALRLLLAALHEAVGNYREAVLQYQTVLRGEPESARAHFALASALLAEGHDRARADAHLRAYLELDPDGVHAAQARAALLKEVSP